MAAAAGRGRGADAERGVRTIAIEAQLYLVLPVLLLVVAGRCGRDVVLGAGSVLAIGCYAPPRR